MLIIDNKIIYYFTKTHPCNMDTAKLAVYEHLNTMNECCHYKETGHAVSWLFSTQPSRKFCYKQRRTRETQYSYEETYFEEKICHFVSNF